MASKLSNPTYIKLHKQRTGISAMKKINFCKKLGLFAISGLIVLTSGGFATDKPFGSQTDIEFANKLWKLMEDQKLVGDSSIKVRPFKGNEPHGTIQEVLATEAIINGHTGRLLVKRNHGGKKDLSVKEVYDEPTKYLAAITVMYKREKGYDSDNQDWFWAKYKTNGELDKNPKGMSLAGRVAKGTPPQACIACHKALGGKDMETLTSK